ncbi:hypothetical protein E2C01_004929 [Portunus trituberculatus]|uniref:Uncharacterized protein n=1 Tax=Portunus trituberculatus TaxID=210409 RepID=A0A5B7CSX8_PORTR|nr:hypothetical protein [Portunus trituberculatus]
MHAHSQAPIYPTTHTHRRSDLLATPPVVKTAASRLSCRVINVYWSFFVPLDSSCTRR